MRVLLMGEGDLAEEVCEALEAGGASVRFLVDADDESVQGALLAGDVDVACVAAREDAFPLRMALLVRHYSDVRLVVTIFDPAMARQVRETIPDCAVTSVADIVAPTLAGPCLDPDLVAVRRSDAGFVGPGRGVAARCRCRPRGRAGARSLAEAVLRALRPQRRRCCSTARSGSW